MLEHIWNPWHGCRKYSEGCAHCYMYYLDAQRGKNGGDIYRVKNSFDLPLRQKRDGSWKLPPGSTVHVCMTSDFFLEEADEWRREAWDLMRLRPDLHFWLQTKRIGRVESCLPDDWGSAYSHVSLCVTAENQRCAEERLPILLALPFSEKHVMCAPMVGPVTLADWLHTGQIGQVIVDGENYDGERPLRYEWVKQLYDECAQAQVRFTFTGTGNVFIRDGKTYRVPKAYQQVSALRSGLQLPPVAGDFPIQPRCRTCPRRASCNGCRWCGKCAPAVNNP